MRLPVVEFQWCASGRSRGGAGRHGCACEEGTAPWRALAFQRAGRRLVRRRFLPPACRLRHDGLGSGLATTAGPLQSLRRRPSATLGWRVTVNTCGRAASVLPPGCPSAAPPGGSSIAETLVRRPWSQQCSTLRLTTIHKALQKIVEEAPEGEDSGGDGAGPQGMRGMTSMCRPCEPVVFSSSAEEVFVRSGWSADTNC